MREWIKEKGRRHSWHPQADVLLAMGILGIVLLLIVPLPPFLLDAFLCFSIAFSVITLLLTLYVENPLEFSSFPTALLLLTLYRLGLNIATTRMILTRGEAGEIIKTFGDFVIQGNCFIGLILFALVTVINFVVVTKGAGRIAEVSARFTLEALPGKQMAIENDLTAGLLTQEEAKEARVKMQAETDFYGAMDGASKFVRGDAIAGIIMIFINLIGGIIVGIMGGNYSLQECVHMFTRLTIGDGLVCQIPALFVSISAGIIVTRSSLGSIGVILPKQLLRNSKVLMLSSGIVFVLSLIPGMPFLVMGFIASLLGLLGFFLKNKRSHRSETETISSKINTLEKSLVVHPIEIQLGVQLVKLAEPLLQKATEIRHHCALRWGVKIPPIHICDQLQLPPKGFSIKLRGNTACCERAESLSDLINQFTIVIESHLHELINRQEIVRMLEEAKLENPAVVEELIPEKLKPGQILRILQNLLKEKVPIRDFVAILELIADQFPTKSEIDLDQITESVRQGLARGISEHFFGERKIAHAIILDQKVEQTLQVAYQKTEKGGYHLLLRPATAQKIRETVNLFLDKAKKEGIAPVLLIHPAARRSLRQLIEKEHSNVPVLSFDELVSEIEVRSLGTISNEVLAG